MISDGELWRLLRALDDPDHLERPARFDFVETRNQFERLVARLNAEFDCTAWLTAMPRTQACTHE